VAGGQERILRRRIRTVESTKKITRAMELIAASRIVRAQQAIQAARPYVAKMREVVGHVSESPDAAKLPIFQEPSDQGRVAIIFMTADRGLAGGYNANVVRAVERLVRRHESEGREVELVAVGRKGVSYFRHRRQPILTSATGISDRPSFADAQGLVKVVMERFAADELDQVELVYTQFRSLGSQVVTHKRLVPFAANEEEEDTEAGEGRTVYEFEPEAADILDRLLPSWLEAEVLAALLESAASEHAARQRAMKAATDNADELIKTLRRVMNRARQDSITTEIMEIVGGAEALRQAGASSESETPHDVYEPAAESA
jgi:F-type H+-transporting ATPase subunit gamma